MDSHGNPCKNKLSIAGGAGWLVQTISFPNWFLVHSSGFVIRFPFFLFLLSNSDLIRPNRPNQKIPLINALVHHNIYIHLTFDFHSAYCAPQRRNHGEIYGATSAMVGQNLPPPGWNRVKASENLGVTAVAPVAPVDTSLSLAISFLCVMTFLYTNLKVLTF